MNTNGNDPYQIDDNRLIEAADAILEVESRCSDGLETMVAGSPKDGQFTPQELVQAMGFLIRLGLVVPAVPAADRSRRSRQKRRDR